MGLNGRDTTLWSQYVRAWHKVIFKVKVTIDHVKNCPIHATTRYSFSAMRKVLTQGWDTRDQGYSHWLMRTVIDHNLKGKKRLYLPNSQCHFFFNLEISFPLWGEQISRIYLGPRPRIYLLYLPTKTGSDTSSVLHGMLILMYMDMGQR